MAVEQCTPSSEPWADIVYQDEDIVVVNKPAGLLSVPGKLPEHYDSMWSRLAVDFPEIQVVHRLDMSTSGLMLLAKHKQTSPQIEQHFEIAPELQDYSKLKA